MMHYNVGWVLFCLVSFILSMVESNFTNMDHLIDFVYQRNAIDYTYDEVYSLLVMKLFSPSFAKLPGPLYMNGVHRHRVQKALNEGYKHLEQFLIDYELNYDFEGETGFDVFNMIMSMPFGDATQELKKTVEIRKVELQTKNRIMYEEIELKLLVRLFNQFHIFTPMHHEYRWERNGPVSIEEYRNNYQLFLLLTILTETANGIVSEFGNEGISVYIAIGKFQLIDIVRSIDWSSLSNVMKTLQQISNHDAAMILNRMDKWKFKEKRAWWPAFSLPLSDAIAAKGLPYRFKSGENYLKVPLTEEMMPMDSVHPTDELLTLDSIPFTEDGSPMDSLIFQGINSGWMSHAPNWANESSINILSFNETYRA